MPTETAPVTPAATPVVTPTSATATPPPAAAAKPPDPKPAAVIGKPAEGDEKPPTSKAWADLGNKQRALVAREAELKAKGIELAAREAAVAEGGTKAEKERIKKLIAEKRYDDLETEFGIDYAAWTRAKLAKGGKAQPAAEAPLTKDAIAKLVAEGIERDRASRAETDSKAQEEAAAAHWTKTMSDVGEMVKSGGDRYEMIASELALRAPFVQQTLQEMAAMDPTIHVDVALDKLEAFFLKRTMDLVTSSSKFAAIRGAGSANPATGTPPKTEQQSSPRERTGHEASGDGPRTLTNVLAADSAPNGAPLATRPLSKAAKVMAEREGREAEVRRIAAKLNE